MHVVELLDGAELEVHHTISGRCFVGTHPDLFPENLPTACGAVGTGSVDLESNPVLVDSPLLEAFAGLGIDQDTAADIFRELVLHAHRIGAREVHFNCRLLPGRVTLGDLVGGDTLAVVVESLLVGGVAATVGLLDREQAAVFAERFLTDEVAERVVLKPAADSLPIVEEHIGLVGAPIVHATTIFYAQTFFRVDSMREVRLAVRLEQRFALQHALGLTLGRWIEFEQAPDGKVRTVVDQARRAVREDCSLFDRGYTVAGELHDTSDARFTILLNECSLARAFREGVLQGRFVSSRAAGEKN